MTSRQIEQKAEAIALTTQKLNQQRKARSTKKTYLHWLCRYIEFLIQTRPTGSTADKVSAFLSTLCEKSAATQKQALNAIRYYYEEAKGESMGTLPAWTRAKRPRRIPSWLTESECLSLFTPMTGPQKLMSQLLFGSGLRLNEALGLRVKDVDLAARSLRIHNGKGDKDRVAMLPQALLQALSDQIATATEFWHLDRKNDAAPVELPGSLADKYPMAGKELAWYWLFPAKTYVRDQSRPTRWHIHEDSFAKALKRAARSARITKRVSAHILRHSFATAYILNGGNIHDLKELLGHAKLETTAIYLHCLPGLNQRAVSPLDRALLGDPSKVTVFPPSVTATPALSVVG